MPPVHPRLWWRPHTPPPSLYSWKRKPGNIFKCLFLSPLPALSLPLSPLITGRENIFKSDSLSFFFPLPDRVTKLISLSVHLTAFRRTLSHLPSLPPSHIPSSLLYCRMDMREKNSWLIHFGILPTTLLDLSSLPFCPIHLSPIIPSLSFIVKCR